MTKPLRVAVILSCAGAATVGYFLVSYISNQFRNRSSSEQGDYYGQLESRFREITADASVDDRSALLALAREIYTDKYTSSRALEDVAVMDNPNGSFHLHIDVVHDYGMELRGNWESGERPDIAAMFETLTIEKAVYSAALLAKYGLHRQLESLSVTVRVRVEVKSGGREAIDAFAFSVPAESIHQFATMYGDRAHSGVVGNLDRNELENHCVILLTNFETITIFVERK